MPPSRLDMLRDFIAQRPSDPFPRYALAQELKNAGDLAGAWENFQILLQDHTAYVATYFHAGDTLVRLGRPAEARQVYQQGLQVCVQAGDSKTRNEIEGALAALPPG